jgi:hypothetical protein
MSARTQVVNVVDVLPAAIAAGQSMTDGLNLGGLRLFGLTVPANWTAANVTFQMSADGGNTWTNMYDASGSELTAVAGASRFIAMDPANFASAQWVKIRSGSSASPVNQAQSVALGLVLRSV